MARFKTSLVKRWRYWPKIVFFAVVVKPLVLFLLGLNVGGRRNLPEKGAAIVAANHNSHLDTLVLMSLFPLSHIHRVRPVAAADYFFKNRLLAWFSTHCIGIIALRREGFNRPQELFADCHQALENGDILIIFPEGSRGRPEQIGTIKKGLHYLLSQHPVTVPVIPVVLRGLGKALPKGEAILVPFNCDVVVGQALNSEQNSDEFISDLYAAYQQLAEQCLTK